MNAPVSLLAVDDPGSAVVDAVAAAKSIEERHATVFIARASVLHTDCCGFTLLQLLGPWICIVLD